MRRGFWCLVRMVLGTFISALREGNAKHQQKKIAEARSMSPKKQLFLWKQRRVLLVTAPLREVQRV